VGQRYQAFYARSGETCDERDRVEPVTERSDRRTQLPPADGTTQNVAWKPNTRFRRRPCVARGIVELAERPHTSPYEQER